MKFKSGHQLLAYYFNNIMEIRHDALNWKPCDRAKEMRELISIWRTSFKLYNYSDIQIWKRMIKLYEKNWMDLHWESTELDKQFYQKLNQ